MDARLAAVYELGQRLLLLRDARPIAEAVLDVAGRVTGCPRIGFWLADESGEGLCLVAWRGEVERPAGKSSLEGMVAAIGRGEGAIHAPAVRRGDGDVSALAVPVQVGGRLLGVLGVDAIGEGDREMLSILVSYAALALENARLRVEERRKAEEVAVLNAIARRIGASLDLRTTLDAVVAAAAELIPCALAEVSLWDEQSQMLTLQAIRCLPDRSYPVGRSFPPGEGYTGWMVRHRRPLLVPDVAARHDIRPHLLPDEKPFRAYAGVPLLVGETLVGTLVLVADEAGAFDERQFELLRALGAQAAVAIHNARLYQEATRRHRELAALYAVAEAANRSLDLDDLLRRALDSVVGVTNADGGAIRLLDPDSDEVVLAVQRGLSGDYVRRAGRFPLTQEIIGWVARTGRPALSEDMLADPRVSPEVRELLREVGHRSLAVVPLRDRERVVGTLGVTAKARGFFDEEDLELLGAIGQQLGVAIANARLRRQALEAERLAAVGRVAAGVAHDLRSPLGGILRSAELLARPELSPATRQKLSRAVASLARRLINTAQGILDYTRRDELPLRLAPCSLARFLDEVLTVLEVDFSDRGIEVVRDYAYEGTVVMDADRMAQVVYNIAANARDVMPEGGTFVVRTRRAGERVELRFTDTGPGIPEALRERVFEPFFTCGKEGGAGLGLAIARHIVREHGGEIWVEGSEEGGATFVVSLPLS